MTNIAFDPYDIKPTTTMPNDFEQFWSDAMSKAAKIPMSPTLRYSEKESNDRVDVYYLKLQSYKKHQDASLQYCACPGLPCARSMVLMN